MLQSMRSQKVRHDWATTTKDIPWAGMFQVTLWPLCCYLVESSKKQGNSRKTSTSVASGEGYYKRVGGNRSLGITSSRTGQKGTTFEPEFQVTEPTWTQPTKKPGLPWKWMDFPEREGTLSPTKDITKLQNTMLWKFASEVPPCLSGAPWEFQHLEHPRQA